MAGEWREQPLSSVCVYLNRGSTPAYTDTGGILVLNQKCVRDQRVDFGLARRTDTKRKPATVERIVQPFDILVNSTGIGTLGRVAQVRSLPELTTVDSHVTLVRPDSGVVDPLFLGLALRCFESEIEALGEGSTGQTELSRARLSNFLIPMPTSVEEQRAIAHILGTLDDKIELNRKQNETLEEMARALFKAWFVDFEPVRAKMDGSWQRGESMLGLPAHLYDLFPDRLVESELGEVPEGWGFVRAGQIYDVGIGKTPPRKESEWFSEDPKDVPWMSIKDLGRAGLFIAEVSEYLTRAAIERFRIRRIPDGVVVLSFKLTVGRVAITDGEMLSNEAIAHFLPKAGNHICSAYLYCYLSQFDYETLGSTSSIATAVNSDGVRSISILVPSKLISKTFESLIEGSFARIRAIQRESLSLAQLRDTLLPRLISGELRIKDAAAFLNPIFS